ncbi:MAG: ketol-acid reductoisomerase [Methanomassiliicoccales archaeon]|nr:ketol-acid reductoisomerase [Methanomassiliicoccales archaeon]
MVKIYHDADADLRVLKGKKIAVVGYGSQGRAQALSLKDSGMDVVVGLRKDGKSWDATKKDGVAVADIPKAVKGADVVMILLPDEVQEGVYKDQIAPNLKEGAALYFSHGFAITYGTVKPPKNVDVIMVAPKSPGKREREMYLEGFGVPALFAVERDYTGKARDIVLAIAKGIGCTRAGVIETNFHDEVTSDLFGEQAVLCGGVTALILAGFETLVKRGYQPELAYFECLHELKLIVDLIQAGGLGHMWKNVSNTAEFGGLTQRDNIITEDTKKAMNKMLDKILSGEFSKEWMADWKGGLKRMRELEKQESERQIEVVGRDIRALFEMKK